jgi:hypothetical protein
VLNVNIGIVERIERFEQLSPLALGSPTFKTFNVQRSTLYSWNVETTERCSCFSWEFFSRLTVSAAPVLGSARLTPGAERAVKL